MKSEFDIDSFYFVSGYDKIHTGFELKNMIALGCVGPDAHCKITGVHEMLLWFKNSSFANENRLYNFNRRVIHQIPLTCAEIVSTLTRKPFRVSVIRSNVH